MLSDNIAMAQGLFRMLLGAPTAAIDGARPPGRRTSPAELDAPLLLDPVEKALLLRQNPLLGRATVEQLLDLAR